MALNPFDDALEDQTPARPSPLEPTPDPFQPWDAERIRRARGLQAPPAPRPVPATQPANPFDALAQENLAQRETQLRAARRAVQGVDPDARARAERLAQQTGLPVDVVERNLAAAEGQAAVQATPYGAINQQSPSLAKWLMTPENAAVSSDDLVPLGTLDWILAAPQRAYAQGQAQVIVGALRAKQLRGETLSAAEQQQLTDAKQKATQGGALGAGDSWFRQAVLGAARQAPLLAGSFRSGSIGGAQGAVVGAIAEVVPTAAVVGAVGGGPAGAALAAGTLTAAGSAVGAGVSAYNYIRDVEGGLAYDEYLETRDEHGQLLDESTARMAAQAVGHVNGAIELASEVLPLLRFIPRGVTKTVVKTTVKQALTQATKRTALRELADTLLAVGTPYAATLAFEATTEAAQRAVTLLGLDYARGHPVTAPGQLEPGTVDLYAQPTVQNPDGTTSTVDSMSINIDGKEVLIPTVTPDGRHLEPEAAIAEYEQTGRHLGIFKDVASANAFAQQVHEDYAAGRFAPRLGFWQDVGQEFMGMLTEGALLPLPGAVVDLHRHLQSAQQARQGQAWIEAIGQGTLNSKTVQRAPDAVQSLLQRAADAGPVSDFYAPVDTWVEYWQSKGVDPDQMAAEVTGEPTALADAQRLKTDLRLPVGRYAVTLGPTEHNTFFAQELKLDPNEMNAREGKAFLDGWREEMAALAAQETTAGERGAAEPGAPAAPLAQIRQQLAEQLVQNGGYTRQDADRLAQLLEAGLGRLTSDAEVDPYALYQRRGIDVRRPTSREAPAAQADVSRPTPTPAAPETPALPLTAEAAPEETAAADVTPPPAGAQTDRAGGDATLRVAESRPSDVEAIPASTIKRRAGESDAALGARRAAAVRTARTAREQQHYDTLFDYVAAHAQAIDPAVNLDALRQEFDTRLAHYKEAVAFYGESGHDPLDLLREIARRGGLTTQERTYGGEVELLMEGQTFGTVRGIKGVFTKDGLSVDQMATDITREADRFAWIEDANGLLDAVDHAIRQESAHNADVLPGSDDLAADFGIHTARRWWDEDRSGAFAAAAGQAADAEERAGMATGEGDVSFDPGDFWQTLFDELTGGLEGEPTPAADTLPTGEVQPRLPGAEGVREQDVVTPTMEAPFSLTSEIAEDDDGSQGTLFQPPPPGFKTISPHLTPEERERLKVNTTQALIDQFRALPADVDVRDAALAGQVKKGWYERSAQAIRALFGEVDAPRFTALLAAMSPQTSVETNLLNAVRMWKNWDAAGRPTNRKRIVALMARSVKGTGKATSVLESWVNNTVRALTTPDAHAIVLSGPKVQSFTRNLWGHLNEVTNDAWMATFANVDQTIFKGKLQGGGTDPGKGPGYRAFNAKIRRVAKTLTEETGELWTPAHVQETVWSWAKTLYELSESAGESAESFLRSGKLTDEAIAKAPDFATLFTADADIRQLLEAAGYGSVLRAFDREARRAARADTGPAAAAGAGPGGADRPVTPSLLRSARRLDDVRRRRAAAKLARAQGVEYDQPAYHGSPHIFDRFSLQAIGSGEGSQVYGWGMYFAGRREVAEHYRAALTRDQAGALLVNGTPVENGFFKSHVLNLLSDTDNGTPFEEAKRQALEDLRFRHRAEQSRGRADYVEELADAMTRLEALQPGEITRERPGRTYTVEIPSDADFLSWDLPASKQSPQVQAALRALGVEWTDTVYPTLEEAVTTIGALLEQEEAPGWGSITTTVRETLLEGYHAATTGDQAAFERWYDKNAFVMTGGKSRNPTGREIYDELRRKVIREGHGGPDAKIFGIVPYTVAARRASEALAAQGIAGIRYLDALSRGAGEGTQNYVVFDDQHVNILEYDQPTRRRQTAPRAWPKGEERDALDEQLDALTQQIRDESGAPGVKLEASITAGGDLYLDTIVVPESRQGKGVGSQMLEKLLAFADAHNLAVSLDAAPNPRKKTALARFYQRHGFVRNGTARYYDAALTGSLVRPSQSERGETTLEQPRGRGRRGSIQIRPGQRTIINLFETADRSTFLHEMGHFFLEVFSDIADELRARPTASLTPGQHRLLNNYEAALKALGVTSRDQIGREQHEKWATLFEQYLLEGKAPSEELRTTFETFRDWLLGIYKSLTRLGVTLTPEVRQVFDRMLATDEQIAAAEQRGRLQPMFLTAEQTGMSPEWFALYRDKIADAHRASTEALDAQLLGELHRERTRAWQTRRAEIRDEMEAAAYDEPVYKALSAIRSGTHPDGSPLTEGMTPEPMKLSRRLITERYGAERAGTLPARTTVRSGGVDPDTVADLFGFSSGDALLTALAAAPPMRLAIEQRTDRRMVAEHGSLLLSGDLDDAAQAAVANEHRELVLRDEIRALAQLRRQVLPFVRQAQREGREAVAGARAEGAALVRQARAEGRERVAAAREETADARAEAAMLRALQRSGAAVIRGALPSADVIKQGAIARIGATRVRNLRPQVFWAAMRKASTAATEAAARGDYDEAIQQKTLELMNMAAYREAENAQLEIDKRVRALRQAMTPAQQAQLGLAGDTWLQQFNGVIDRYGFATVRPAQLEGRGAMSHWIPAMEDLGHPVEQLPAEIVNDGRRIDYRDVTYDEFLAVTDGAAILKTLARDASRLRKKDGDRDFARTQERIVASMLEAHPTKAPPIGFDAASERHLKIAGWFASHARIATLVRSLDGFVDGGPFWDAFQRPLNEAANQEEMRTRKARREFGAIIERYYPGRQVGKLHQVIEVEGVGAMSRNWRISVALNWGNETSRDRILSDPQRKWDRRRVEAILNTLDDNDLDFVQATWDYIDTYWEEIKAKQERVTGLAPEKVAASAFTVRGRELRGGYYPLVYDGRMNARAQMNTVAADGKLATQAAYVRSTTKRGHVELRKQHVELSVKLDISVVFGHLEQVIHDLTHHEALLDANRLLRDKQISDAIYKTHSSVVYEQLRTALQDIALGHLPTGRDGGAVTWMRQGAQIAGLGWNMWTAVQQPLGLYNGIDRVGAKWVFRGMKRWLRDAATMDNTVRWITDSSMFMSERFKAGPSDTRDLRRELSRPGGWFDRMIRTVTVDTLTQQHLLDSYLWMTGFMQRFADVGTWLGGYEKAMASGVTEEKAIAMADQAVIDSQGSSRIVDLSQVQRGEPTVRAFLTFYSYGSAVFNSSYDRFGQTSSLMNPAQVTRLLGHILLIYALPATTKILLENLVGRRDDDDPEEVLEAIAGEMLSTALNTMLWVRETTVAVETVFGLQEGRGYAGPAGLRLFEQLGRLAVQIHQREVDEPLFKALNQVTGLLFHYPAAQVERTVEGWAALEEGRTHNPAALIFGPPKEKAN